MAEMDRFYRDARMLMSSANALVDEYRETKRTTTDMCSKYVALIDSEAELQERMQQAGVNAGASPEIMVCLQRVAQIRQDFGEVFETIARRVGQKH